APEKVTGKDGKSYPQDALAALNHTSDRLAVGPRPPFPPRPHIREEPKMNFEESNIFAGLRERLLERRRNAVLPKSNDARKTGVTSDTPERVLLKSNDAPALAEKGPSELAKSIIAAGNMRRGEKSTDAGGSAATVLTGLAREIVDAAALCAAGGSKR